MGVLQEKAAAFIIGWAKHDAHKLGSFGPVFLIARRKVLRNELSQSELSSEGCKGWTAEAVGCLAVCEAFLHGPVILCRGRRGRLRESALSGSSENISGVAGTAKVSLGVSCEVVESKVDSEVAEFCSSELSWVSMLVLSDCSAALSPPGFFSCAGRGRSHAALFRAILDHVLCRMAPIARGRLARVFKKDF